MHCWSLVSSEPGRLVFILLAFFPFASGAYILNYSGCGLWAVLPLSRNIFDVLETERVAIFFLS